MTGVLLDLDTIEYAKALELQKEIALKRANDRVPDTLLLLEHDHVITLGRKTTPANFRPQNVPVFQVERGGDATYHGPGQLVGYPIVKLADHDVRKHVRTIESALLATVQDFGVEAERIDGHPGVWVRGRKLASIGVAVTDWVSFHGFALNVNTDLSFFGLIRPCGLDPSTMTSMREILGKRIEMNSVKEKFAAKYSDATGETFAKQETNWLVSGKR